VRESTPTSAPADYRLGDPIALHDLLALPPDGRRYARDDRGRLALMSPDRPDSHRYPLACLVRFVGRTLDLRWEVVPEPPIGFDPIYDQAGDVLPPSRLGHKRIVPDLAVWDGTPDVRRDPGEKAGSFSPARLRLVVEVLSAGTYASDLGTAEEEQVDRWRTYLVNGVPEYWIVNASSEACGLPPRSGLFLRSDSGLWRPLAGEGLELASVTVNGLAPVTHGRVESSSLPGLTLDLEAFWAQVDELE